jgi:hypothetical protein
VKSINQLRELAAALERGEPVPPGAAKAFTAAFRLYETKAPEGLTLDRALKLIPRPGGRTWWYTEALERRDAALIELGNELCPDLDLPVTAKTIIQFVRRYQRTPFRLDKPSKICELAMACSPLPGERQLQAILATGKFRK